MPIPLVALVAAGTGAWFALRTGSDDSGDAGAQDTAGPDQGDTVSSTTTVPADLSARTLSWRDELADQAPELDTDVLLRWVQRESDGNPAAVGSVAQLRRDGWAREAGIGQVYFETQSSRAFGVTSDELRAGATAGQQTLARELTAPERAAQTGSLIAMCRQYILDGGNVLQSIGQEWSASDIYCLAKLKHALPVLAESFLHAAAGADASGDWNTFRDWLQSLSLADSESIYRNSAAYYGAGGKSAWRRYLDNAQYTGRGDIQ